jgi:hypothetical protein
MLALAPMAGREFLTNQTTCASVLSKRTTFEIFWQKRPPGGGDTSGQLLLVDGARKEAAGV